MRSVTARAVVVHRFRCDVLPDARHQLRQYVLTVKADLCRHIHHCVRRSDAAIEGAIRIRANGLHRHRS